MCSGVKSKWPDLHINLTFFPLIFVRLMFFSLTQTFMVYRFFVCFFQTLKWQKCCTVKCDEGFLMRR
ncbi:hypothetical protein XELAEV_18041668mg [Xenopus laevis]|uniref:Uncharacterized protein n=1 Tax=Xenopus laevis TaxID=8355 RepID=A0A974C2J6_XENLA|nr:hypothetical protein XELAEV_18041668mg [Xenopus laevis]